MGHDESDMPGHKPPRAPDHGPAAPEAGSLWVTRVSLEFSASAFPSKQLTQRGLHASGSGHLSLPAHPLPRASPVYIYGHSQGLGARAPSGLLG